MEPRVVLAPGARRRTGAGESADETKYDGRNVRETFKTLQRLACGALVVLALIMLAGDGLMMRSRLRASYKQGMTGRRDDALSGSRNTGELSDMLYVDQPMDEEADSTTEEDVGVMAADDASQPAEEDDPSNLADAWAAPAGDGINGEADPALAELAEAVKGEALANKLLDAEAQRKVVPEDAPIGAPGQKPRQRREGGGSAPRGLNEMADPPADWSLKTDHTTCEGYFGNGFSLEKVLIPADAEGAPAAAAGGSAAGGDGVETDESDSALSLAAGSAGARGPRLECRKHPETAAHYCAARDVILHPGRIKMSRGGEELEQVMGRDEDTELPAFEGGAVEFFLGDVTTLTGHHDSASAAGPASSVTVTDLTAVPGAEEWLRGMEPNDPYKARMLKRARMLSPAAPAAAAGGGATVEPAPACQAVVADFPVLFVTRVEYANLFHTSTDWWNVWQAARILGYAPTADYPEEALRGLTPESARQEAASPRRRTPRLPVHVVFLDGHNASPMDDGWAGLVLSVNYAKHFEGPTCFAAAVFVPYGYHAAISQGMTTRGHLCGGAAHIRQFGHDMVRGLSLTPRARSTCGSVSSGAALVAGGDGAATNVVFVRRVHYKAHPRHDGKIVRRLDNEDEIYTALEAAAAAPDSGIRLLNGLFSSMTVTEQIAMIQEACIVVGAHGAGLSHILFAPEGEHMLEIQPPSFQRPHFVAYTNWAASTHHLWATGSSRPPAGEVVTRLKDIVAKAASGGGGNGKPAAAA